MQTPKFYKTAWLFTVLMIAGATLTQAQTPQFYANWTGTGGDGLWNNGANWDLGVVPGADVNGITNASIGNGFTVSYNTTASGFGVFTNNGLLAVNGGAFNCSAIFMPRPQAGPTLYLTNGSGDVTVAGSVLLNTNGVISMVAGTSLTVGGTLGVESASSSHASGNSSFTNSGGTLNANSTSVGTSGGTGTGRLVISGGVNNLGNTTFGRYSGSSASTLGTEGVIINGGVVTMSNLTGSAASHGTTYITGGTVTNYGNVTLMGTTGGRYLRVVQAGGLFVVPEPGVIYPSSTTAGTETARYQVTGGTNIVGGIWIGNTNTPVAATATVTVGGSVYVGSEGILTNGAVLYTISLNSGGVFGATADWTDAANMQLGAGTPPFTFQAADVDGTSHNITINGILGGNGGLGKTGAGTLTLNAANTYLGTTLINGGSLVLGASGSLASSPIIVGPGATFDVSGVTGGFILASQTLSGLGTVLGAVNAASGATINPGSNTLSGALSLFSSLTETNGGVINHFDLTGAPNPNNDFLDITGDLNVGGSNQVDIAGASLVGDTNYVLIHYGGAFNGSITNFGLSPSSGDGTLTNDPTAQTISFIPATPVRGPTNTVWIGNPANTNWDTQTSTNWLNASSGELDTFGFVAGDNVQFTDLGASNSPVNIANTVLPGSILFNSQSNYVFASTSGGAISGVTGLTVANTGTLTILTTNTYSGGTLVNGGTLEVSYIANSLLPSGIGAASSDPSTLILTNGGQLRYIGAASASTDHGITLADSGGQIGVTGGTLTLNNAFSGPGALTKRGAGELRLNVNNTTSGGILVSNGTLTLASGNAAGTGVITNIDGTTLKLVGAITVPNIFNVSGNVTVDLNNTGGDTALDGEWDGNGTVTVINQQPNNSRTFTMGGNGNGSGGMANFSGTVNAGTNSSNFRFNDGGGNPNLGGTNVTFNLGTGTARFLVRNGGVTVNFGSLFGVSSTMLSGRGSGSSGTVTYSIGGNGSSSDFSGIITNGGGGSLTALLKVGAGTLTLRGQSVYTGTTTISNGVLALASTNGQDASIGASRVVDVKSGAVFDVTGQTAYPGTYALGGSQVLQGNGTVNGKVDMTILGGGTIAPGSGLSGSIGTLTVTGNIYMTSTSSNWMKINRSASPNCDQINSSGGSIYYAGTLVVANVGPALQVGDKFTLFTNVSFGGGVFDSLVLPGYYTWDTSQLGVNGSITVAGVLPHPKVTSVDFSGLATNAITLNTTNGIFNTSVTVATSTNLALPFNSWTVVTNTYFDANGNLTDPNSGNPGLTIYVDSTQTPRFFMLQTTGN